MLPSGSKDPNADPLAALRGVRFGRREREMLLAAPPYKPLTAQEREAWTDRLNELARHVNRAGGDPNRLLDQEPPGMKLDAMYVIDHSERTVRVAQARAARKLDDLGLVAYFKRVYGDRRVHIHLTALGAEVVERYRHELEHGRRIRWP